MGKNVGMEDPSDIDDYSNWIGGFYELAIELGPMDDTRLERLLAAIWRLANATGPYVRPHDGGPSRSASLNVEGLTQLLHGVVRLPNGQEIVCGAMAIREDGPDCLIFYVPVEALQRTDARVGGFMGGEDPASLVWRRALDRWLADLAIRAYPEAPFLFAAIGHEAFAFLAEESAAPDKIPAERHGAYVMPLDGVPHYFEATI
jgi:hypothetical protein